MLFEKNVSRCYCNAKRIHFYNDSKIVLMSDVHRGDGSAADDFYKNENIYYFALYQYYNENYTYIELGDGDELWENKKFQDITNAHCNTFELLEKFHKDKRLYLIYGNHDKVKSKAKWRQRNLEQHFDEQDNRCSPLLNDIKIYEGIVLEYGNTGNEILLTHGHQVDFQNYNLWRFTRFLVRYLWRPLELIGIKDPSSAQKNHQKKIKIQKKLTDWVKKENKPLIAGHTHRYVFPKPGEPPYFNDGCCVHPHHITAIEITGGMISLVEWSIKTMRDGTLYVKRDIVSGPEILNNYFYHD